MNNNYKYVHYTEKHYIIEPFLPDMNAESFTLANKKETLILKSQASGLTTHLKGCKIFAVEDVIYKVATRIYEAEEPKNYADTG